MTIHQLVLMVASDLYGNPDQQTEHRLRDFCTCAVAILSSRLRQGLTYEDCRENFTIAAALLALSMLRSFEDGEVGLASFDAGTLSLHFDSRQDQLSLIVKQLLAPWCDYGSAFVGVVS